MQSRQILSLQIHELLQEFAVVVITLIAQVTFQVKQNASANGTIDPSHIMFKFSGTDVYGNAMDPAADEYSGISVMV